MNLNEETVNDKKEGETEKPDEVDVLFTRSLSKLIDEHCFSDDKRSEVISKLSLMRFHGSDMKPKSSTRSESEEATAYYSDSNDYDYDWIGKHSEIDPKNEFTNLDTISAWEQISIFLNVLVIVVFSVKNKMFPIGLVTGSADAHT